MDCTYFCRHLFFNDMCIWIFFFFPRSFFFFFFLRCTWTKTKRMHLWIDASPAYLSLFCQILVYQWFSLTMMIYLIILSTLTYLNPDWRVWCLHRGNPQQHSLHWQPHTEQQVQRLQSSVSSSEAPARTNRSNETIHWEWKPRVMLKILNFIIFHQLQLSAINLPLTVHLNRLWHERIKRSQATLVNKELTWSFFKAMTERPSPPDQSWSCLIERQEDTEKNHSVHLKTSGNVTLRLIGCRCTLSCFGGQFWRNKHMEKLGQSSLLCFLFWVK